MYKDRRKQLYNYLKSELQVDCAIIMDPINIFYYTGFNSNPHERFFALAIDVKYNNTILFVPSLDEEAAQYHSDVPNLVAIADDENSYDKFAHELGHAYSTLAIEKKFVTIQQYEQFQQRYSEVRFLDISLIIGEQRLQKSSEEIKNVQQAITITENALSETLAYIKPGMTEQQVKSRLEYEFILAGADDVAFVPLVLSGEKAALPHGATGKKLLERGDFLLFDIGVTVNGYHSDLSRTFIIGEETNEQRAIYETVREANIKAIKTVQIGESLKEIDLAARNYIESRGYGEYFTHRIGHGLGLEVHELPSIHEKNKDLIKPGMLFTVEPGIYIPKIGGVRIEDNIYVHEDGEKEVLSSFSKNLKRI